MNGRLNDSAMLPLSRDAGRMAWLIVWLLVKVCAHEHNAVRYPATASV